MKPDNKKLKKTMMIITIIVTILLVAFIIYSLKIGILDSKEVLIERIKEYGLLGPIFFLLLQAVQVVFPVIPGGASCLAGVLAFGPVWGFIYNYVGLTIGSIIAFFLARKFGLPLLRKLFADTVVDKYLGYIQTKKFEWIFFLGILIPGAPDDILCYIAGISKMTLQRFIIYVLIGKPLTLVFYSLFMKYIL